MSDIRATVKPPSLNRFRAGQGQIDLASWCLLRFFHEDPHNYNSPASGRYIQRPRNPTATLETHFPQATFNVLNVRLAYMFETHCLNQIGDPRQPCPHVCRQCFDPRINRFIQSLDRPSHLLVYQKRYKCGIQYICWVSV